MLKISEKISSGSDRGLATTSSFLPRVVDDNEPLRVMFDDRGGYAVLFLHRDMLGQPTPFTPYWAIACGDEPTMRAIGRWLIVRREDWQEWADLVDTEGHRALDDYLHGLLAAEPPMHVTATMLRRSDEAGEISLSEILESGRMSRTQEVARHRFVSQAALDRFMAWFNTGRNFNSPWQLIQLAYCEGTDALGRVLDELAERQTPGGQRLPSAHQKA